MNGYMASIAARELGISTRTLALWADNGKIKAYKTVGGWRLYPPAEIEKLRAKLRARPK